MIFGTDLIHVFFVREVQFVVDTFVFFKVFLLQRDPRYVRNSTNMVRDRGEERTVLLSTKYAISSLTFVTESVAKLPFSSSLKINSNLLTCHDPLNLFHLGFRLFDLSRQLFHHRLHSLSLILLYPVSHSSSSFRSFKNLLIPLFIHSLFALNPRSRCRYSL